MQQGCDHRLVVHPKIEQDAGHGHGMHDIRLSRVPALVLMGVLGKLVGLDDLFLLFRAVFHSHEPLQLAEMVII